MKQIFVVFLFFAISPAAAFAAPKTTAIVDAKIVVSPTKTIAKGTVLFRGGKIVAAGAKIRVPANAKRINGTGKTVTAGLIEASSRVGMVEVGLVSHTNEGSFQTSEGKNDIHASYLIPDGFNPNSVAIPITRTGGVTNAVIIPSGGLISGAAAFYDLSGSYLPEKETAALVANLGMESRKSGMGSRGRALERLRDVFGDAELYAKKRKNFEANQLRSLAASYQDLAVMGNVLNGRVPLIVNVNRASDINAALRLKNKWKKLRLIISGGTEAWMVAEKLAKAKVPVLVNPTANLPSNFDRTQVRNDNVAHLERAGVRVVLSQLGEQSNARNLRQIAGVAVSYGLSKEKALASVTTLPASIFGLKKHGALRKGNFANLVIWSGDPFELSTRAERVFIKGREMSLETRQSALRERYRQLPSRK